LVRRQLGLGVACFRGFFGILDSHRSDVAYEGWRGHKLDRRMLELLRGNVLSDMRNGSFGLPSSGKTSAGARS
jgi:hypothetical protein